MINTIYLVKKDVNKPYSQENWLMMNVKEFNAFVKPPDARGRYFADVGGHEYDDIWYIVECPKENAIKWRKEFNRHYYLKRTERESGYQTVSYHMRYNPFTYKGYYYDSVYLSEQPVL